MIRFEYIGQYSKKRIISALENIYINSFPSNERIDFRLLISSKFAIDISNLASINGFGTFGIFNDNDILGLLSFYRCEKYVFNLYFAIDSKMRSNGWGSQALSKFHKFFQNVNYIYEIDFPTDEKSKRRIDFYKRNGLFINDFGYLLPPLQPTNFPLPMLIGSYPTQLIQAEYEEAKNILYKNVYIVK